MYINVLAKVIFANLYMFVDNIAAFRRGVGAWSLIAGMDQRASL
jgi:hypothetical protein